MSLALPASKNWRFLRRLKQPNPSSFLFLRQLCGGSHLQSAKQDHEAIEATVTEALQLLQQIPPQDWASSQPLQTLIGSSPNVPAQITRRLSSHSEALNFFDFLRSNSQLQDPQSLSSTFQVVLEVARRDPDSPRKKSELYRIAKESKVPITANAAVILIRCFGRAEMVEESVTVFNELDPGSRNTHVRNVFIQVLMEAGRVDDAMKVLDEMLEPESEIAPNSATEDTFFRGLWRKERKGRWLSIEEIVGLVMRLGKHSIFPDNIMLSKLISSKCRSGKINEAWDFLHELINLRAPLEASCFNVVLTELGKRRNVDKMNLLLKEMKECGVQPNKITVGILINHMCKLGRVDEALEVFKKLRDGSDGFSVEADVISYNTLIDGLCKVGRQEESLAMMDQMRSQSCAPNTATYNCLIDGFCKGGEIDKARQLFDQMSNAGVKPNVITLNTLISGMCRHGRINSALLLVNEMQGKGLRANAVTYTTLISAFCSVNNIDKAFELFDRMLKSGCSADAILYYSLISGLCQAGRMDDASDVFSKLKEAGFRPDMLCYNVLINGFCKRKKLDKAYETLREMEEAGMKPDAVTYNTLITYFSKSANFSVAKRVMEKMMSEGNVPTVATYGALIHGFCLSGQINEALEIFRNMKTKSKVFPNTIIYNMLIESLSKNNKVETALSLMEDMKQNGVKPNTTTYNAAFKGLKEKNCLEETFKLMDRMIKDACHPNYITMEILTEWLSNAGEVDKLKTFLIGCELSPPPTAATAAA